MRLTRLSALLSSVAFATLAAAQPLSYAQASVQIKAGVLVLPGQLYNGVAQNAAPHVWGNLDQDQTTKPAKWSFSNPLGPTVLTSNVRTRWAALDVSTPPVNTRLNKNSAPYWEVNLDSVDDRALAQFNVLSLTVNQTLQLNAPEREKLRRYLDQGGVLWVDLVADTNSNLVNDVVNPAPLSFGWVNSNTAVDANLFHPVLQFPNPLSLGEVTMAELELPAGSKLVTTPVPNGTMGNIEVFEKWIEPDSTSFQPVAGTSAGNTISVGKVGQGFMVLTSRGMSANLNRGYDTNTAQFNLNRGFNGFSVPSDAAFIAAAKLAVNIVSLGGLWTGKDGGSRHTGSMSVDLTAPLLRRFSDNPAGSGSFDVGQQPALYKGRVVVSKGNRVYVYDARPDRDIDGDGSADDGLENPIGVLGDLVWVSPPLGGKVSAPTVVEAANTVLSNPNRPGFRPTDQVWVTDDTGAVHIFDLDCDGAAQGVLGNWPPLTSIAPPNATVATTNGPYPVVIHESLAFVTDAASGTLGTTGRVWIIDVDRAVKANTSKEWAIFQSSRMPEPSAACTVGYIPIQDGSGGLDRVVYVPTMPNTAFSPRPCGMTSLWLGARSESPINRDYDASTQVLQVSTRASYNGLPILLVHGGATPLNSLGLKFTLLDSSGNPLPTNTVRTILGNASVSETTRGVLQLNGVVAAGFDLDGKQTAGTGDDIGWRIDYTIDWSQAGAGAFSPSYENYVRGNLEFPDDNRNLRQVIGSPVLGPNGNIYLATSFRGTANGGGGSYFTFKENRGPGNFSMVGRFELYDRLSFALNNTSGAADTITMRPVLTDNDTIVQLIGFLNQEMNTWQFTSGPVLRGDTVYLTASAIKPIFTGVKTGVTMAFKAETGPPTFEVQSTDSNFTIVQSDPAISVTKNAPEAYSVLQQGQFTVEPIGGSTRSRVVLNSLMNVTRGRIRDSINFSLPVIVRRGGQTDTLIEPEALSDNGRIIAGYAGGKWNPLVWYTCFNGFDPGAGPFVGGQTLFQGGASVLPSLILNNGFAPRGMVFAMDANISANDEFLQPNPDRPWTQQFVHFLGNNFNNVRVAPALKWPQFKGINDMDDLRIRILQAAIEEDGVSNISGGDDTLAVTGPNTLYAFSRSDILVVDAGRISRFDPAGNPIWITDQTVLGGRNTPTSGQGSVRQLSEPNRMYPAGGNGYWVVDTGNNRVVRTDGASREIRTIESFRVDPTYVPAGLPNQNGVAGLSAGEGRKLRRPKDVLSWETLVDGSVAGNNPFSNPQPLERWVHTMIADSGNNRIVELVDRYQLDPATGRYMGVVQYEDPVGSGKFVNALGVLNWHTPEEFTGRDYSYNSIARVVQDVGGVRHNVIAFGFGNVEPGKMSLGLDSNGLDPDRSSGYGGIVLYDGPNSAVIREFKRPAILAGTYLAENPPGSGSFSYSWPTVDQPERTQKLVGLSSVTLRYVDVAGALRLSAMVTDSTGVYELVQDNSGTWVVRWMMPIEAYTGMRHPRGAGPFTQAQLGDNPRGFRPTYAKRLDSGEVLLVNGYSGTLLSGATFQGEVVLVDGTFADGATQTEDPGYALNRRNLGFNRLSVKFELPPVQGARGVVAPVFAARQ
ncbi:MAG: DUF4159 domain-containing protein [Armatimonadetes bacterium]|nr:DUF4159 domain-containing protein [Armatimonadota bacterium]